MTDETTWQLALDDAYAANDAARIAAVQLVFADQLEDWGDEQERYVGYRWMGENGKRPELWPDKTWNWWDDRYSGYRPSNLPAKICLKIIGRKIESYIEFPTRRAAEEGLCKAILVPDVCQACGGKGSINTGPGDYGDEFIPCPACSGKAVTA